MVSNSKTLLGLVLVSSMSLTGCPKGEGDDAASSASQGGGATPGPGLPETPFTPQGDAALFYDDGLATGVMERGGALSDLAQTTTKHSGERAIALEPDRYQALHFHLGSAFDGTAFNTLQFFIHGGEQGGQRLRVSAFADGQIGEGVEIDAPAQQWTQIQIPFADMGVTSKNITDIWIQDATGGDQTKVFLDDLSAIPTSAASPQDIAQSAPPTPAANQVIVEPDADRRPINPHVFGANFATPTQLEKQRYPVHRWGGNHASRYAWDVDTANRAMDWYFMNVPEENLAPELLPHESSSDKFIDSTTAAGGEALVTLPMLGWVPKERADAASYSVKKYGAQDGAMGDAGNGHKGGKAIANDKSDAARPVGAEYVTQWMEHIASRTGTAKEGGVRFFALDNEMTLWPETHRDIHPEPVTYDEIWNKTVEYGKAAKAQDPDVKLFGPMAWGWCAYFDSSGACGKSPDKQAHNDEPLLPWYLDKVCEYQRETGVRLVDYLTIHYYPQNGLYSQDDSPAMQEKRLQAVKSMYDPNYVDGSWIEQPIMLVPRMKQWIAEHCPGTKLAITEYNFGGEDTAAGALAQAEVQAVFAREGVDFATRWWAPADGVRAEDAVTLYRNYDAAGGTIMGDSVRATTFNVDKVGSYAVRRGKSLYVLLFNKSTQAQALSVDVVGGVQGGVKLYGFDQSTRLGARGNAKAQGDGFSATLPARSATLAVVTLP